MTLLTAFQQQCLLTPDQLAFVEEDQHVTYRQFQYAVNELSGYLQSNRESNQPIAIFLERGIEAVTVIYAILMLGGCYLPLDKNNPIQRVNVIIEDALPQFIVGIGSRPSKLSAAFRWIDLHDIDSSMTFFKKEIVQAKNLAAILYTSGST
jgi:non-ribosomal peptide synthetase component F